MTITDVRASRVPPHWPRRMVESRGALRAVIESAFPNSSRSEVASIIDVVPIADYEAHPGFEALVLDEQVVIPWRIYNPQPEPSARMV
jgi:hypothetical protein